MVSRRVYIGETTEEMSEQVRAYVRHRRLASGVPVPGSYPCLSRGVMKLKREEEGEEKDGVHGCHENRSSGRIS
ncbi:hypothetical protein TorRG33x02_157400 [Trema orientale]|uniref:Uncharacterized protein n=1 Tax=Trema orientale TaxID=63057 RepID=A0A2P5ESL6_TREOI|nr:hypothetical protein TorRG33x02_157400 [Trema orientale]